MYFKLLLPWLNCLYRSIVSVVPRSVYFLSNTCYSPAGKFGRKTVWSPYSRTSLPSKRCLFPSAHGWTRNHCKKTLKIFFFFLLWKTVKIVSHFVYFGDFLPFLQQRQTHSHVCRTCSLLIQIVTVLFGNITGPTSRSLNNCRSNWPSLQEWPWWGLC